MIVHFQNHLSVGTGIHWHGIELPNEMDGTPFTQNVVPPGGSFLYYFKVTRPGIFWYHPHHDPADDTNTNQVFSGLYGMIIVRDPNEAALQASGTLPPPDQTKPIVLSDTTVCKAPGSNDTVTYPNPGGNTLPWVGNPGGGTTPALPVQANPTPKMLCETPTAVDGAGNLRPTSYAAGDIPSIQQTVGGRENEGQTVLTNGKNVGGRAGSPAAPGALAPGASTLNVRPGQGLRLELVNTSAIRYFRLHLTDSTGTNIPLIRVGGEGGLLDNAVEEGGTQGTWVTGYDSGEIVLAAGLAGRRGRRDPRVGDRGHDDVDGGLSADGSGLRRHPDRSGHASERHWVTGVPGLHDLGRHTLAGGHRRPRAGAGPAHRNAAQPGDVQPCKARQRQPEHQVHRTDRRQARSGSTTSRHRTTPRTTRPLRTSARPVTRNPATRSSCR